MNAIQVETDPQNTHMLLGGLMLCVQDSALFEECAEINVDARQTSPAPNDTNLLSSGMQISQFFCQSAIVFSYTFSLFVGIKFNFHILVKFSI